MLRMSSAFARKGGSAMMRRASSRLGVGIRAAGASRTLDIGSFSGIGPARGMFGSSDDDVGSAPDLYEYPHQKTNTIINTCDQGKHHVIQRFGKFSHVVEGGLYFCIPFIDSIIEHDMREMTIEIAPQTAVTRDNVYAQLSGVLFVQITDAKKATYGIRRPLISVVKAAEAAMRNALGEMELDECFREKDKLNQAVMNALTDTTAPWGLEAKRYEVTDIDAPTEIKKAMNLQASAERQRREKALGADADAAVMQKLAKAQKQKDIDESLGAKARAINEAEGNARAIELKAEAERIRVVKEAEAMADANKRIAEVMGEVGGDEALRFTMAMRYVDMFGNMAGESNTLFMNQDMGEMTKVLAKGYAALDTLGAAGVLPSNGETVNAGDPGSTNAKQSPVLGIGNNGVRKD